MGEYIDALNSIDATVVSPNNVVTVSVARQNETKIRIDQAAKSKYDEASLALEIETAIFEAWAEVKSKVDDLNRDLGLPFMDRRIEPQLASQLEQIFDLIASHETSSSSGAGNVQATLRGDGELYIELLNSIVRRTDVSTHALEVEIEQAVDYVRRKSVKETKELFKNRNPR